MAHHHVGIVTHGTSPHNLVAPDLRSRIYGGMTWKRMYNFNEASIIDTVVNELKYVGGCVGTTHKSPSLFLCLLLKSLHLNLTKEVLKECLTQPYFKYLTVLAAVYARLVLPALECWTLLEPLLDDYRKIIVQDTAGVFTVTNVDSIVYDLLHQDELFDLRLPHIPKGRYEMELLYPSMRM
eukprot:PhF_6_TR23329/c0_g2_i4/m.33024/K12849/PRPF38A; pre-mRNA-splicing factor 38A